MNVPELLRSIGDRLATGATVKAVYGEPVSVGERTVIPVARVSYAFGGGGGGEPGEEAAGGGGGGGGRVSAQPCGALEITPAGTRFVEFPAVNAIAAVAVGFLVGVVVGRITRT